MSFSKLSVSAATARCGAAIGCTRHRCPVGQRYEFHPFLPLMWRLRAGFVLKLEPWHNPLPCIEPMPVPLASISHAGDSTWAERKPIVRGTWLLRQHVTRMTVQAIFANALAGQTYVVPTTQLRPRDPIF